jgi:hypothetical protein
MDNTEINEKTNEEKTNEEKINDEIKKISEEKEKKPKNDWEKFGISIITNLITVLLVGLLGANFIFFSRINLDYFFPTNVDKEPYVSSNQNTQQSGGSKKRGGKKNPFFMKGGNNDSKDGLCGEEINYTNSKIFNNKYFKSMYEFGFPYNLVKDKNEVGIFSFIKEWFSNKVMYSYQLLRKFIQSSIGMSNVVCSTAGPFWSFVLGPVFLLAAMFVSLFWGVVSIFSFFINENQGLFGYITTLVGFLFGYTFITAFGLEFVQIIGLIFSLFVLPLMINKDEVLKTMSEGYNSWYLRILFFIFVLNSAFKYLDNIIAVVMLIVFLPQFLPPGYSIYNKNNGQSKET